MDPMAWTTPDDDALARTGDAPGPRGPESSVADLSHAHAGPSDDGTGIPRSFDDYQVFLAGVDDVLDRVDGALARLDDGTYGTCEVCTQPIADSALEATPTARHCERHLPLGTGS